MIFSHKNFWKNLKRKIHHHHLQHLDMEEGRANDLSWESDHQEGPKDVIGIDTYL